MKKMIHNNNYYNEYNDNDYYDDILNEDYIE